MVVLSLQRRVAVFGAGGGLPTVAAVMFLLCQLVSCSTRLVGGLDEGEANHIISVLEQEGIAARKRMEGKRNEAAWTVYVAAEDAAAARMVLKEARLPREKRPGMARLFSPSGIIPTAEEQRNRKAAALSEELSKSLEGLAGVVEARVLVSLPSESVFAASRLEEEKAGGTASVLLSYRGRPSFSVEDVQRIVAGAVTGLDPQRVTVVMNEAPLRKTPLSEGAYRSLGPFQVAPSSRKPLLWLIVGLLGCNLALAAIVVLQTFKFLKRRRGSAAQPQ